MREENIIQINFGSASAFTQEQQELIFRGCDCFLKSVGLLYNLPRLVSPRVSGELVKPSLGCFERTHNRNIVFINRTDTLQEIKFRGTQFTSNTKNKRQSIRIFFKELVLLVLDRLPTFVYSASLNSNGEIKELLLLESLGENFAGLSFRQALIRNLSLNLRINFTKFSLSSFFGDFILERNKVGLFNLRRGQSHLCFGELKSGNFKYLSFSFSDFFVNSFFRSLSRGHGGWTKQFFLLKIFLCAFCILSYANLRLDFFQSLFS